MMAYGRDQGDKNYLQLEVVSLQEQHYPFQQDVPIGFEHRAVVPSTTISRGERRGCWKQ